MKSKTDWTAIFHRVVSFPVYLYLAIAMITSFHNLELSFNCLEWSVFVRTVLASVVAVVYGLVAFGYLSGNFKVSK